MTRLPTRAAVVAWVALVVSAANARAQCADGTPPPCAAPVRVATRTANVPSAGERARRFLILPFRNVTRQAEHDWLIEGSTTMLSDALAQWQGITVVSDEKLYPALKRAGISSGAVADAPSVRRVAEETGGWTAVTGEVLATGGRVRVSARAWDIPTNRELVRAASEVPTGGDVREAFDSVSLRLLKSVGLDSVTTDLANATTRDLDAYRAYLRGLAHVRRTEIKSALTAFEEAIRRDSSFALAWARLADMILSADPMSILQPMGRGGQASARAVALSAKLPPRQRALVLAGNAQFRAQFTEARRLLEGILKEDSTDVEALSLLTGLEQFDPILVPASGGGLRPRGSLNASARLAKRVTQLDPTRHSMFGLLASLYASAGVPNSSPVVGIMREPSSFPDMLQMLQTRENVRAYYAVLRDSLVLVPVESLSVIPKDSLKAMRKAARTVGKSWAERWLTVAGDQAAPHQLMSILLELDHDYVGALRELAAAESIGVQTPAWSAPARRLVLLGKSGDLSGAGRIADSLSAGGFFANPNSLIASSDAAAWSFGLHLLRGRVAHAQTLYQQASGMRRMVSQGSPTPELTALRSLIGNEDPEDEPGIPRELRARQMDSVVAHLSEFVAAPQLGPWVPMILAMLADVADTTKKRSAELLKVADALAAKGPTLAAFHIASNAVANDSTLEPMAAQYAWYRTGAEAFNALRLATQSRFKPGTATVSAQQAVFEWRVDDATPFTRHRAETPPGRAEYRWDVVVDAGERYYRLTASPVGKSGAEAPMRGTLAEIRLTTEGRSVSAGAMVAGVMKDTTRLMAVGLRTETAPGVLRMIVSDPTIIGALRRTRPSHARFRFEPCVIPVGTVGRKQCVDERVAITYAP
jgi:TolB-like protein